MLACKRDDRIGEIFSKDFCDTPITMTRNAAVCTAREAGADLLMMVDSDQHPDRELEQGDPLARPFWDTSFDFVYERYKRGLISVVGSPYCGPPPINNVYVFRWANWSNHALDRNSRLEQFGREEAAHRMGIEEVAALPTGLILYDLRAFDTIEPPYFYYEYSDAYQREKSSTEDVTNTRDISMHCQLKYGYSPIFCNWDAWAGHWKPLCVEKPKPITIDQVGEKYQRAVEQKRRSDTRLVVLGDGDDRNSRMVNHVRRAH